MSGARWASASPAIYIGAGAPTIYIGAGAPAIYIGAGGTGGIYQRARHGRSRMLGAEGERSDEPTLDAVKAEDRPMVRDVLRVLQGVKVCSTFTVNLAPRGYEILGWVHTDRDIDVNTETVELVQQVNPLRVRFMGYRVHAGVFKVCLRVRVISLSEPCMMSDSILYSVRKRARWFDG